MFNYKFIKFLSFDNCIKIILSECNVPKESVPIIRISHLIEFLVPNEKKKRRFKFVVSALNYLWVLDLFSHFRKRESFICLVAKDFILENDTKDESYRKNVKKKKSRKMSFGSPVLQHLDR